MKLTSKASDYALLLIMHLAKSDEQTMSVRQIANDLSISLRFLANIANKLSIARILNSSRGVGGGIRLALPASEIKVAQIIEAVDGPIQTMFCQNTSEECSHLNLCEMKSFWDDIQNTITHKLKNTSIADLINNNNCCDDQFQPLTMNV